MKKTIYCISGLGTDEKIFDRLKPAGVELKFLPWLKPQKKEKIEEYASRMASPLTGNKPIVLGVSFGGMIGIEIAKQMELQQLIIISSIKSYRELPRWMRVAGAMQINKVLPTHSYKFSEKVDTNRIGAATKEERAMVKAYRRSADPVHLEWAINQVLNWKNDWRPDNLIHIHGDKDRIFPVKNTSPDHILKEGTHMIIYNRTAEIGKILETL